MKHKRTPAIFASILLIALLSTTLLSVHTINGIQRQTEYRNELKAYLLSIGKEAPQNE